MIRKFKNADMVKVLKIWLDASIIAHDFINKEFWISKLEDMRDIYLPNAESYVYVGEDDQIKGFICLCDEMIAAIFVEPSSQGMGVGKALLEKAKSIYPVLMLAVYKDNQPSISFYNKQGFVVIGEQIDHNTGCLELGMQWTK